MSRDDQVYLEHIRDAIDRIEQYTKGIDESGFQHNLLIQDGVVRQLGIIGEAVKRLSKPFRDSHARHSLACYRRHARQIDPRLLRHQHRNSLDV